MAIAAKIMYMRNPNAMVAGNNAGFIFVSPDGSSICIRSMPASISRLMEFLREPRSREEVEQEIQKPFSDLQRLVTVLEKRQIILADTTEKLEAALPRRPKAVKPPCKRVVVGICGAVQAAMMLPLLMAIHRFISQHVEIVLTESAENFVTSETLSYFGFRVWKDMYASHERVNPETSERINVPHIYLAGSADLVLIIPATASTIHKLASGACSDLLSLVVSVTKAPVIVVPTMNPAMFDYTPVRKNLEELRACGFYVVEPGLGFEVSTGCDDHFKFSGIGFTDANILRGIAAVLAAHHELTESRSSNNGAASSLAPSAKSD